MILYTIRYTDDKIATHVPGDSIGRSSREMRATAKEHATLGSTARPHTVFHEPLPLDT
jgi:hypothetical protein